MRTDLKVRMELIWRTGGCACPSHLVSWTDSECGHKFMDRKYGILLWYRKGKMLGPRPKKIKGKGFSFLPKLYGRAYHGRFSNLI